MIECTCRSIKTLIRNNFSCFENICFTAKTLQNSTCYFPVTSPSDMCGSQLLLRLPNVFPKLWPTWIICVIVFYPIELKFHENMEYKFIQKRLFLKSGWFIVDEINHVTILINYITKFSVFPVKFKYFNSTCFIEGLVIE